MLPWFQFQNHHSYVDVKKKISEQENSVETSSDSVDEDETFTDPEEVSAPDPHVFEVTQTREMKRKGIRLPRGWKILGTRIESEIQSNGESYNYFRIDWHFKSPEGKIYTNLKKVLSVIRQNCAKYERWEVVKKD